ncbi:MAG: DUF1499 domain-containing protein [Desulfuromonadaceae bacterium]|nr:DUF1499 domain-containing protein [Desulfuromonadaceae bacterium]
MKNLTRSLRAMTIGLLGLLGCAGERPNNLGTTGKALSACPASPNCVSSQAADEKHQIAPLTFNGAPEVAFSLLKRVLKQRDDATIIEEKSGYLRVELRTLLFVDDGEFLLDRKLNVIQVRSASRLGYSDLGKNRSRMEQIRRQFIAAESNLQNH